MKSRGYSAHGQVGAACACVALACIVSCDRGGEPSTPVAHRVRIASLSPGITATVVALGGEERLVGRTPWCETSRDVAVVGTLLDLNAEALVAADPTLVLVQPPSQGEDRTLATLAAHGRWRVASFQIESLTDVEQLVPAVAEAIADSSQLDDRAQLTARADEIARRFQQALSPLAEAKDAGNLLIVLVASEGADAMAFGKGTYLGEFLDRIGATNAVGRSGYPTLSTEELLGSRAQTIIVLAREPSEAVDQLRKAMPNAVICALHSPQLLQPGGGMIDGLMQLRAVIKGAAAAHASAAEVSR